MQKTMSNFFFVGYNKDLPFLSDACRISPISFTIFYLTDAYEDKMRVDPWLVGCILFCSLKKCNASVCLTRVSVAVTYNVVWTTAFIAIYFSVRYIFRNSLKNESLNQ